MNNKKPLTFYTGLLTVLLCLSVILNAVSWKSAAFSDWIRKYPFKVLQIIMSHISNLLPFSFGELLLLAALLFILWNLILWVGDGIIFVHKAIVLKNRKAKEPGLTERLRQRFPHYDRLYRVFEMGFAVTALIMTITCFTLYHCTEIGDSFEKSDGDYTFEELAELRDALVAEANQLSKVVTRDKNGIPHYEGDLKKKAREAMGEYAEDDQVLSGYYSIPKPLRSSGFLCQQNMCGYYFPFTMEANYNTMMTEINVPFTMCHELSHTKGYIREDEANYIACVVCLGSDDDFFRYSGVLGVLYYVDNDFLAACGGKNELYKMHPAISSQVKKDNVFITEETKDKIEKKAVVSSDTVRKATETYINTTLNINGIASGKVSYSEVVGLLLGLNREKGLAIADNSRG